MAELPVFRIAHASEGRLRLRMAQPLDADFLGELGRRIAAHSAVVEVRANHRTGSLLVLYGGEFEALLEFIDGLGLVQIAVHAPHTPMLRMQRALEETEERLAQRTRGVVSLGSLTFATMAATGLWQAARGRLLPAGMTLFQYALEAMVREAEHERAEARLTGKPPG